MTESRTIESRVDALLAAGEGDPEYRQHYIDLVSWFLPREQLYWLFTAEAYNYDSGDLPLVLMLTDPKCDIAVAKTIFWMFQPDAYWLDEACWQPGYPMSKDQKVLMMIVERTGQGLYQKSDLTPGDACFAHQLWPMPVQLAPSSPPIPACLTEEFTPSTVRLPPEEHPEQNRAIAATFSALQAGF